MYFCDEPSYSPPLHPQLKYNLSPWLPPDTETSLHKLTDNYHNNILHNLKAHLQNRRLRSPNRLQLHILTTLQTLSQRTDIVIKPADKNLGTVVLLQAQYHALCMNILSDTTTYRLLTEPYTPSLCFDSLKAILNKYNKLYSADTAHKRAKISTTEHSTTRLYTPLATSLLQLEENEHLRIPIFYVLPKMHKSPVQGRPIVASIDSPTYHASIYLHNVLLPLQKHLPAVCTNSAQVIRDLYSLKSQPNTTIVCADVKSLYPSIPTEYGLRAVHAVLTHYSTLPIPLFDAAEIPLTMELLRWVLENNYLQYNGSVYHQQSGTAMGTPTAVTYANIVISFLERNCLKLKPLYYSRYLDDLLILCDLSIADTIIGIFNAQCDSIQLDGITKGKSGIYLDLEIYIAEDAFVTKVYQKPMNTFQYITPSSAHTPTVFNNIVRSELTRYRLLCSLDRDFQLMAQLALTRFKARGYTASTLETILATIPNRATLLARILTPPPPKPSRNNSSIIMVAPPLSRFLKIPWGKIMRIPESLLTDYRFRSAFGTYPRIIYGSKNPDPASRFLTKHRNTIEGNKTTNKKQKSLHNPA